MHFIWTKKGMISMIVFYTFSSGAWLVSMVCSGFSISRFKNTRGCLVKRSISQTNKGYFWSRDLLWCHRHHKRTIERNVEKVKGAYNNSTRPRGDWGCLLFYCSCFRNISSSCLICVACLIGTWDNKKKVVPLMYWCRLKTQHKFQGIFYGHVRSCTSGCFRGFSIPF